MNKNIQNRYTFSIELVKQAGNIALSYYLNRNELVIECKKGDKQDQVSVADKSVETMLRQAIAEKFPADGFLGEEFGYERGGVVSFVGLSIQSMELALS
ncbi:inositol monophosphatase family protein [Gallibacterium trehalosifermentans]|uniref:Inositol monophosphatase family protein n=1 Tax=Gallibacterium trehalosifermentans TaxID=516935 RepID=A0ABV6H0U7_9PAST